MKRLSLNCETFTVSDLARVLSVSKPKRLSRLKLSHFARPLRSEGWSELGQCLQRLPHLKYLELDFELTHHVDGLEPDDLKRLLELCPQIQKLDYIVPIEAYSPPPEQALPTPDSLIGAEQDLPIRSSTSRPLEGPSSTKPSQSPAGLSVGSKVTRLTSSVSRSFPTLAIHGPCALIPLSPAVLAHIAEKEPSKLWFVEKLLQLTAVSSKIQEFRLFWSL